MLGVAAVVSVLSGCAEDASDNATQPSLLPLALDVDEIFPRSDVVATLGQSVPFEVRLGPEHGESIAYEWFLDGEIVGAGGSTAVIDTADAGPGRHVVRARIADEYHEASLLWTLQVVDGPRTNREPAILQAVPPGARDVLQGERARFAVVAADVDVGDELTYAWHLDGSPLVEAQGTDGQEIELDTSVLSPGSHVVSVVVSDGVPRAPASAVGHRWRLEVLSDGELAAPQLNGAWPWGSPRIDASGVLRFEVSADAANLEDSVRVRWEVDGVPQDEDGTSFQFRPLAEEDGTSRSAARVTCRLLGGRDGADDLLNAVAWTVRVGADLTSPAIDSENLAPFVEAAPCVPSAPSEPGQPLVFRVAADDPEGDLLTYRWSANGKPLVGDGPVLVYLPGMEAVGDPLGAIPVAGEPTVEVSVEDGLSSSGPVVRSWTVPGRRSVRAALTMNPGAVIMDNGQAGTSTYGTWTSSSAAGYYGSDSVYSKATGNTYTYTVAVPSAGKYEVHLWWTQWSSRDPATPVSIRHASGTASVTVNQTTNGGKWNLVGTWDFSTSAQITITSRNSTYSTCADAVCVNPVSTTGTTDPPPAATSGEIIIDDGSSGTSYVGTWNASSAPSPYNGRSLYSRSGSYSFARSISSAGTYDVYAWWTANSTRESAVPIDIVHASGTATVVKDQRSNGGKWNLLGRYSFSSTVKVVVRVPGSTSVCADAVRFVLAGSTTEPPPPPPPPPTAGSDIILDNGQSGTIPSGTWTPSSAPNSYGTASVYARGSGTYTYDVVLPSTGVYGVYVWYTEWSSRESRVPYAVLHSNGTTTVYLDQRTNGGKWIPIGDYTFGSRARITISVVDTDTVSADAVRLVPGGGAGSTTPSTPPPTSSVTPEITDVQAFALTPNLARVSWRTNFLASSTVDYGRTTSLADGTKTITGYRAMHSVVLKSLLPNTTYYVRARSSNGTTSKTAAVISFKTPTATPAFTVVSTHPRLFFTRSEITSIRSRVATSPFSTWWSSLAAHVSNELSKSISTIITEDPDRTVGVAFYGLIANNSSAQRHAINVALAVAKLSASSDNTVIKGRIELIAPVYDWLYDYCTSSERTTLRSAIVSLSTALEGMVRSDEYAIGHSAGNQSGALLGALAVYYEDSAATAMVTRALQRYHVGFLSFWREHCSEDGGSHKSAWYTSLASEYNYRTFAAWKSATGQNLFQQEAWFEKLVWWYIYGLRGDMEFMSHGDIFFADGAVETERYLFLHIAREYKNGEAQWLANRIRAVVPVWGPRAVWETLWYDPSVAAKTPSLPLNQHLRGAGMVFFRESQADDSVRAYLRAPPYYVNSHTHLDHCSFSIYYRKGLAIDSGIYDNYDGKHWRSYYSRTIAHNSILVKDPAEQFIRYGDVEVSDGGQKWPILNTDVPYHAPRTIEDLVDHDYFRLGGVAAFEDTSLYSYTVADGKRAYKSSKMAAFFRHFLWIKSLSGWTKPVIVIFDEVESTNSTFKKTYLLHTQTKPTVSGTQLSATNGTGMLFQRTVFPASPAIVLVGGSGMEYSVNGVNYPPARSLKSGEEAGVWRAEVSPPTGRLRDEFLHVLYPAPSGSASPPAVRSIDASSMKGVDTQNLAILFSTRCGSMSSATYSLSAARKNLLFGVNPGRNYTVTLGSTVLGTFQATVQGTLEFDTAASGTVKVVLQ